MIQTKLWGKTECIFTNNTVSIHRIIVNKEHMCSKHCHSYKYNMFYIQQGRLKIETWDNNGLMSESILDSGQTMTIMPGLYHRFVAIEDTLALEIYYSQIDENDIIRTDI